MNIVVFYSRINYIGVWRNGRCGAERCYKLDLKEILVGLVTFVCYCNYLFHYPLIILNAGNIISTNELMLYRYKSHDIDFNSFSSERVFDSLIL